MGIGALARPIEARNGSEQATMQVVFGTQYIDEPVRLDVNTDPASDDDCLDAGGSAACVYHQDANYNVVCLTDATGAEAERRVRRGDRLRMVRPGPAPSRGLQQVSSVATIGLTDALAEHRSGTHPTA